MKKILFLILFSLIYKYQLIAKSNNESIVDSLLTIINSTKNDTHKLNSLSTIAQKYWSINPPEGLPYATKALDLAKKMNWKSKICEAYGVLGINYVILSDNIKGALNLEKSLALAKEIKDYKKIALASGALGNLYYFQSNLPLAIDYYLISLRASEKSNSKNEMAAALSNIGVIYSDMKELDKALSYFEKALKINTETGFKIYQAINMTNIDKIYHQKLIIKK